MNTDEFKQAWVMLLAQPWAKDYTYDPAKEAVQRNLYASVFKATPGDRFLAVVWWWVSHETKWPLISDLKYHLGRMFPPAKHEPLTKAALLAAPIVADNEPWQGIIRALVKSNGASIYAIGVPILRQWMQGHPGDATTAERLARWEQRLNESEAA